MRVYLRAFELDDYKLINKWRKDNEITKFLGGNKYFISSERDRKWIEEKIFDNKTSNYLAICLKDSEEMIGYLSIINIDWRNRNAEWGGIIIGNKEHQRKGYSKEAAYLMLDFIFNELGMNRFYGYWLESNKASIQMGLKLGFKQEGILRECIYKNGKYNNLLLLSILKKEFEKFECVL